MSSASSESSAPSLERKRRRKLAADDPLRSPAKLLAMLDAAKDKLAAENDSLAVETGKLERQWQTQPKWENAAAMNELIVDNFRLRCRLCMELERCQHLISDQQPQQQQQQPQPSSSSSDSASDQQALRAPADGGAGGSDGDGASLADDTSLATHSETGGDGQVTDEDIDAALGLFILPSPESHDGTHKNPHGSGRATTGKKRRRSGGKTLR